MKYKADIACLKWIEGTDQIEGLVSVIMPAYNSGRFISIAIDSVMNQTYTDWELLIVDDCSTDNTAKIVSDYLVKDKRIKYFKNLSNSGAAASRNKAVKEAKGQYLAFLDSDDIWKSEKLEKQINFMRKNKYTFTCTSYSKIDKYGENLHRTVNALTIDYEDMLRRCPGNSTVVYDASKLGKFIIPLIKKRNDYVMWLKVIKSAGMLQGLDEILSCHRILSNSISSNKASLVKYHWVVYKDIEKIGMLKSTYLIVFWIAKTIFRIQ